MKKRKKSRRGRSLTVRAKIIVSLRPQILGQIHFAFPLRLFRLFPYGDLYLGQPLAFVVLIPDPVDIALPDLSGDLIAVFFDVLQYRLIGLRESTIGAFVINAGRLYCRQGLKAQISPIIYPRTGQLGE